MRVDPTLVRSGQWWDHKIPPVIAAAAIVLGAGPRVGVGVLVDLVLFLVATVGVAAFGHVVNDLADIRTDAIAGAPNQMAPLSPATRTGVLGVTILAGALPWIWLPHDATVLTLLGVEVVLLTAYSVRPVRLKDRAALGVLADALYAYVVPILLTGATFGRVNDVGTPPWQVIASVAAWMLLMGLRGILWHQIADLAHDRRSGVRTLATRIGADRAGRILGWMVLAELTAAAATLATIATTSDRWWLPVFGGLYLLYRVFQVSVLWSEPLRPATLKHHNGRIRFIGFVLLNEFVERWLPVAALAALAVGSPIMWLALVAHLLLFDNAVFEFFRHDLDAIPDAVNRLAHEVTARRNIRVVAERRRQARRHGPASVTPEIQRRCRWVFVVCGPELHVLTLATAVKHLRPLSSLEIWVVTDSTRNVRPIDVDGIDRIVDVTTPAHFDDHQASIWLKTGIHRHLPPGEWCYLDSDIVAVRPGIEAVFDQPRDVIAFASDLPIAANRVDRFSPWAMTCGCSRHGEDHSCGHLREQLATRFGLEVPADWVHWNGGVFRFGPDSAGFLDMWNETAIASFAWPEWRTRDQGALIVTAWAHGLQAAPRLPQEFNFIADLGNSDLCLDPERGWSLHPSGPWKHAYALHLHTSRLEDPEWDLSADMEAPIIRQTLVRIHRWKRSEIQKRAAQGIHTFRTFWSMQAKRAYWATRERLGVYMIRIRHVPQRLRPARVRASLERRVSRSGQVDHT